MNHFAVTAARHTTGGIQLTTPHQGARHAKMRRELLTLHGAPERHDALAAGRVWRQPRDARARIASHDDPARHYSAPNDERFNAHVPRRERKRGRVGHLAQLDHELCAIAIMKRGAVVCESTILCT